MRAREDEVVAVAKANVVTMLNGTTKFVSFNTVNNFVVDAPANTQDVSAAA